MDQSQAANEAVYKMDREIEKLYPVLSETPTDAGNTQQPFSLS